MNQTYWCRIVADADVTIGVWDSWCTGYTGDDKRYLVFALKADDEDQIYDLLIETLCGGSYQIDFIEPKDWLTYGDFAGEGTRFPMAKKYLEEEIDHVNKFLSGEK